MSASDAPVVVWFREDLRIADHAALQAAADTGRPVVPVYVLDDETPGDWRLGGACRWWLHHSLTSLARSLEGLGVPLLLRRGVFGEVLTQLVEETDAAALYFSRGYEPWIVDLEQALHGRLTPKGVEVKRFAGRLLFEPEHIRTGNGDVYKVFTPFWRACRREPPPREPHAAPASLQPFAGELAGEALQDWQLLPTRPDWSGGLADTWTPGEDAAHRRLGDFLEARIADYHEARDLPGQAGTSGLSPHLRFGEISPRQVWHRVVAAFDGDPDDTQAEAFLRELGWRDFNSHLLKTWPDIPDRAFKRQFEAFPWREDEDALRRWQRGDTGYPIVDAGMRQLYTIGWMHNRVRMIVASFLVKHLLLHWRKGELWFWDTLVDADLANNAGGWQWAAGSGADAAPYFRIFNPTLQGKKFDPDGTYVRHWVPELAEVPDRYVHEPSAAPARVLEEIGLALGNDYPEPMVPHKPARERALAALKEVTG